MSMGTRQHRQRQEDLWITHNELAQGPAHPFYQRLNELLDSEKFDEFVEKQCAGFYSANNGRPSLAPGMYFRLLLLGYFEGIDSERGIADIENGFALYFSLSDPKDRALPGGQALHRSL